MRLWLHRLLWATLLLLGGAFTLENRHVVTVTLLGDTYAISAYFLFLGLIAGGVVLGVLVAKLKQ